MIIEEERKFAKFASLSSFIFLANCSFDRKKKSNQVLLSVSHKKATDLKINLHRDANNSIRLSVANMAS